MNNYVQLIKLANIDIYQPIKTNSKLWIPTKDLENIFNKSLVNVRLINNNGKILPNRSRSKKIKELIAESLGYPIPKSFKRTKPRFPGQNLDAYGQERKNLQIWNQDIDIKRRYVLIKIDPDTATILKVKVINGTQLSRLNTTNTRTQKYQAILKYKHGESKLLSNDTDTIKAISQGNTNVKDCSPTDSPSNNHLLPIEKINELIKTIIGEKIPSQLNTREQGDFVHKLIVNKIGYKSFSDNGQFPDITNQLLEIKAQTSPTIDLGLFLPTDNATIPDITQISSKSLKISDSRFAIVYIKDMKISSLYLLSGKYFFDNDQIVQTKGRKINSKIQIPLPKDFWN